MKQILKVHHLKHSDIDFEKWDKNISQSQNRMIYAQSWYLNAVSPDWEALISDDYLFLMPLPVKKKWGLKYIVQPILSQQLGIFSSKEITENIVSKFIQKIPYYSYDMHLNEGNPLPIDANKRLNLLLSLNKPYEKIFEEFSKNTKRNINLAKRHNLDLSSNASLEEFLEFYKETDTRFNKFSTGSLEKIFKLCKNENALSIYSARNENKKIVAAVCILHSFDRLINVLPISNDEGKQSSAMFLLIDKILSEHANSEKIFDFEGSMLQGVARFFKGFGAKEYYYGQIKRFRPKFLIGRL